MKVLATFDGSQSSEAIMPQLCLLARVPGVEFALLSLSVPPRETERHHGPFAPIAAGVATVSSTPMVVPGPEVVFAENRGEAVERVLDERRDYLCHIVSGLPAGPKYELVTHIAADPASAIIQFAMQYKPDVIVMGTHGATGMVHRIFGDVAEEVVRSSVAPVLLVHPNTAARSDR